MIDVFADFYADSFAVPFFAQSFPAGYVALLQFVPVSFQESPYDGGSFLPERYVDYLSVHRLSCKESFEISVSFWAEIFFKESVFKASS